MQDSPGTHIPGRADSFDEILAIIENARERAFLAVNRELINMYWRIGEYVSRRAAQDGWGKSVLKDFSDFIQSRDIRKTNENPSVGLILCARKGATVVEYALSRSLSPALVAEYTLHLPDKRILENKLRELADLLESAANDDGE